MNRLSVYDPFADVFPELFRGMLAPRAGNGNGNGNGQGAPVEIRVDVKESADEYQVHAELPGVAKEDIHVQIDGNRVSLSAEIKRSNEVKEGERVLRSERYYGSASRSFQLASEIDESRAQAKYDAGVLTLTLPKRGARSAAQITVN